MYLYKILKDKEYFKVAYVDTDSVVVQTPLPDNIVHIILYI